MPEVSARRARRAVALALMLTAQLAQGQVLADTAAPPTDQGPRARTIAWDEVVRAVDAHPLLAAAALETRAREAMVETAGAPANPTFTGTLGHGAAADNERAALEWGVELELPLDWLVTRGPRVDMARAEVSAANEREGLVKRDVLLELSTMYWNLAYAEERTAALEARSEWTARLAGLVGKRVARGEGRPTERLKVELEMAATEVALERSRTEAALLQTTLGGWLFPRDIVPFTVAGQLARLPAEPPAVPVAAEHDPGLKAKRAEERARAIEVEAERRGRFPALALAAFANAELDRTAVGGGLSLELPLFDRNRGRIEAALAAHAKAGQEAAALARSLHAELTAAARQCLGSRQVAARYEAEVLPRAEASVTALQRVFELGEVSLFEVVEAERARVEAALGHLEALRDAQLACRRLAILTGDGGH